MRKALLIFCCVALLAASAAAQSYTAILTGPEEVPNAGDPDGLGVALITIDGTTIRYSIVTQNIGTPTLAHIHRGAAGVAGSPIVTFDVNTLGNGSVNVTENEIALITANPSGFYVNVHTAAFPGGAVRGQLVPITNARRGAQYVPVVGKVTGAAGTNFVTDLRIVNQSSMMATVVLDYFQQSESGHTSPTATTTITVAPGEQRVINDIIGFLGSSGLGALRVTSTQNVDVLARVLNDLRGIDQGTAGFSIAAGGLDEARTSGTLGFLSAGSVMDIGAGIGFRTNIGYFNPNSAPVTATFTAHRSADGSILGSRTITIPALAFAQMGAFDLINTVGAADQVQQDFYVTWTSTQGPLFVYAAVVDNRTGDSVLVQ